MIRQRVSSTPSLFYLPRSSLSRQMMEAREAGERGRREWISDVKRRLGLVCAGELPCRLEVWSPTAADATYEVISDHRLEVPRGWPPDCRCVLLDGEQVSLGGPCPVHAAAG